MRIYDRGGYLGLNRFVEYLDTQKRVIAYKFNNTTAELKKYIDTFKKVEDTPENNGNGTLYC